MKEKVAYVIDSTLIYSKDKITNKNTLIAQLGITIDGEPVDQFVNNKEILDAMNEGKKVKTNQPAPGIFLECYKKHLENGMEHILVFTIASTLSGTCNSANLAKNMLTSEEDKAKIKVIETKTADCGSFYIYEETLKLIEKGITVEETLKIMEQRINDGEIYFMVDDLKALKENGRLGNVAYFVAKLLKIKPIISFKNNAVNVFKKAIGGYLKAKRMLINILKDFIEKFPKKKIEVVLAHTNKEERCEEFLNELKNEFPECSFKSNGYISQIVTTHVGKGALGFYLNYA